MEPVLTFEQWLELDKAYHLVMWGVPFDKAESQYWQNDWITLLLNYGLASSESTFPEQDQACLQALNGRYTTGLSPRKEAKQLWKHWIEKYGKQRALWEQSEPIAPTRRSGYIYVLKSGAFYKIGRTREPLKRFPQIELRLPVPTRLWALYYEADMYKAESAAHSACKQFHTNGEWFALPDYLAESLYWYQPTFADVCIQFQERGRSFPTENTQREHF